MEEIEREHMRSNWSKLLDMTKCTEKLYGELINEKMLLTAEVGDIKSKATPMERAYELFRILETKKGGYKSLVKALKACNQTGATEILEKLYSDTDTELKLNEHDEAGPSHIAKSHGLKRTKNSSIENNSSQVSSVKTPGITSTSVVIGKDCTTREIVAVLEKTSTFQILMQRLTEIELELGASQNTAKTLQTKMLLNLCTQADALHEVLQIWVSKSKSEPTLNYLLGVLKKLELNDSSRKYRMFQSKLTM